jgi:hypothetical protein
MKQDTLSVIQQSSTQSELGHVILALNSVSTNACDVLIGRPGTPNIRKKMSLGDMFLYQTPEDGILEIRLMELSGIIARFLITQVAPATGFAGGIIDNDVSNSAFSDGERARISDSIENLKEDLKRSESFEAEKLDLVFRTLDEIRSASERLGRKDWINYVAGTLTTVCISAAFAPEQAQKIFQALNSAFLWLFSHSPIFLQW